MTQSIVSRAHSVALCICRVKCKSATYEPGLKPAAHDEKTATRAIEKTATRGKYLNVCGGILLFCSPRVAKRRLSVVFDFFIHEWRKLQRLRTSWEIFLDWFKRLTNQISCTSHMTVCWRSNNKNKDGGAGSWAATRRKADWILAQLSVFIRCKVKRIQKQNTARPGCWGVSQKHQPNR